MAERFEDMMSIGQALARYCRGIDRLDPELIASAYWPDAYDNHGPFQGPRDDFVAWVVPAMRHGHSVTNFSLGQSYFEFRGDQAAVETVFVSRSLGPGEQANSFRILSGRYADLFEKRAGEWRIFRRTVMYDSAAATEATPLNFPHAEGSRSRDDVSYRIFEMAR
jgi:hypothetical protein